MANKCKIRINLNYLSPTTRSLLKLNNLDLNIEDKKELALKLTDILFKAKKEKEFLIDSFDKVFTNNLMNSENENGELSDVLSITRPTNINLEPQGDEQLAQYEIIFNAIMTGKNFNLLVKNKSEELGKKLMDKVDKYLNDDGTFINPKYTQTVDDKGNPISLFRERVNKQAIDYLRNVYFELSILRKTNLGKEDRANVERALSKIKKLFEDQKQVLFFPKYVSTKYTSQNKAKVYWVTENPKEFDIITDSVAENTGEEFDSMINNLLIHAQIEQLDDEGNQVLGVSIKTKDKEDKDVYHLYHIKKVNGKRIVEYVQEANDEFLFIPDVDFKVSGERDMSYQWDNEFSINSLTSPRVNKYADNLYNYDSQDLYVELATDTSQIAGDVIKASLGLDQVLKEVQNLAKNVFGQVFENTIFSEPVFLKGRIDILKKGALSWNYENGEWSKKKHNPTELITKGLTDGMAMLVKSIGKHVGSLDPLNFKRIIFEDGVSKVKSTFKVKNETGDIVELALIDMTDTQLDYFIHNNFSIDYKYIADKYPKSKLALSEKFNKDTKNIPITALSKYAFVNKDTLITKSIEDIKDNYKLKLHVYKKALEAKKEGKQRIELKDLGIIPFQHTTVKQQEKQDEWIKPFDISEISNPENRGKFTFEHNGFKAIIFKTYFYETIDGVRKTVSYYQLTNVEEERNGVWNPQANISIKIGVEDKTDVIYLEGVEVKSNDNQINSYVNSKTTKNFILKPEFELIIEFENKVKELDEPNKKVIKNSKRPKLLILEKSAYGEIELAHKKIEVTDTVKNLVSTNGDISSEEQRIIKEQEELLKEKTDILIEKISEIQDNYVESAKYVNDLINKGWYVPPQMVKAIGKLIKENPLVLDILEIEYEGKTSNGVKKIKIKDNLNFEKVLNTVELLSIQVYLYNENVKKLRLSGSKLEVLKADNDAKKSTGLLNNLIHGERFEKVIPQLTQDIEFELFNVVVKGKERGSEFNFYIPVGVTSKSGATGNFFGISGFRFIETEDNKKVDSYGNPNPDYRENLDQMYAMRVVTESLFDLQKYKAFKESYNSQPIPLEDTLFYENESLSKSLNFNLDQALTYGFMDKLEYTIQTHAKNIFENNLLNELNFSNQNSELAKLCDQLLKIHDKLNKEDVHGNKPDKNEIQQNEEYKKKYEEIRDYYFDIYITGVIDSYSLSYNTKKEDWIGTNDKFPAKNKLTVSINTQFPIFKQIRYVKNQEILVQEVITFAEQVKKDKPVIEPTKKLSTKKSKFQLEGEELLNERLISQKEMDEFRSRVVPFLTFAEWETMKDLLLRHNLQDSAVGISYGSLLALRENKAGIFYHESFHYIFNKLFTKAEQDFYIKEIENRLVFTDADIWKIATPRGIVDYTEAKKIFLEEKLADEFALFKLNQPTALIGKIGVYLKDLFRKLTDWIGLTKIDNLRREFIKIDKGQYAKRNPNSSKFTRFMVARDQDNNLIDETLMQSTQKYLFYSLLHKKVDYKGTYDEKIKSLNDFLTNYLQLQVDSTLPVGYNMLQNILLTINKKGEVVIDQQKLKDYYVPFLEKSFGFFSLDEELSEAEDIIKRNEEKDKSFDDSAYNYDPVNIGSDLLGLVSQIYSVVNDYEIPEFTYLNSELFVRKLQKYFSTVPINPEAMVHSFYQNLSELSDFDPELLQFKELIDKIYRDENGWKNDVALINKLVVKIVLEQQIFHKGLVVREKYGEGTFEEFEVHDAFHDMHKEDIIKLMNNKKSYENSQFVLTKGFVNGKKSKNGIREVLLRVKVSPTVTRYYRLGSSLQASTEEVFEVVEGKTQFTILKGVKAIPELVKLYEEKDPTNPSIRVRTPLEKAAIASLAHTFMGLNVDLTYAHLFVKTYDITKINGASLFIEKDITTQFNHLATLDKKDVDDYLVVSALRYGTALKVTTVRGEDGKSVYALSKSNALKIFKTNYKDRIKNNLFIPNNRVAISFSHKENRAVDFTDLGIIGHLQFNIAQFKKRFINLGQLEGNKTNFFIKVGLVNYKDDTVFHSAVTDQYITNINAIIENYKTIQGLLDSEGLISEENYKQLEKDYIDSIVNFKWEKVGDKYKPTFIGKGVHKGFRIYYNHGIKIDGISLSDMVNKVVSLPNSTNGEELFKAKFEELERIKDLLLISKGQDNINNLVEKSVLEIQSILQKNVEDMGTTIKKNKKIDYYQENYREFLTDYVRTYLIETDNLYKQVFGDKYFEAFDNSDSDFTKRMKSLAIYGENIHAHTVKMQEDVNFWVVEDPKRLTEKGGYKVITNEEYEDPKYDYKAKGKSNELVITEVEATDGQAYNTFLHKYFIQLDKGRSFDLTRAYYTYLMTDRKWIWKEKNGKQELEQIVEADYSREDIEKVKKLRKYLKNTYTESEAQEAIDIFTEYGVTNIEQMNDVITISKENVDILKDRLYSDKEEMSEIYDQLQEGESNIELLNSNKKYYKELDILSLEHVGIVHNIWNENKGRTVYKNDMLKYPQYRENLEAQQVIFKKLDENNQQLKGTYELLNKLKTLKLQRNDSKNNLKITKEHIEIMLKYAEYLNQLQFIQDNQIDNYENILFYLKQQEYLDKVEKDAVKNKYKNGIFKGATIFVKNGHPYYLKNSEATLEKSMYMKANPKAIAVSESGREYKGDNVGDINFLYERIAWNLYHQEQAKYANNKGVLEYEDEDGDMVEVEMDFLKQQLNDLYTLIYDLHEAIHGQELIFEQYKELEITGIDVMAFQSGNKITKYSGVIEVDFGGKMNQSEMPNDKNLVIFGTQLEKILQNDIDPETYVTINGKLIQVKEVILLYNEAISNIVKFNLAGTKSQLLPNNQLDIKVFSQLLKQFVSTTRNADFFESFFDAKYNPEVREYEFEGEPDQAVVANIYFQALNKIINDPAHFKMNGEAYQLISTTAYMVVRDKNGNNIPLEFREKGVGTIEPLQPLLEIHYHEHESETEPVMFEGKPIEVNGKIVTKPKLIKTAREVHETVVPATEPWMREYMKDRKKYFLEKDSVLKEQYKQELDEIYPNELFYMLGNRIPTENKRSIAILKIVDFFIPQTGSVIVTSAAVQSHTGGDHDGDKFFSLRFNVKKVNGKWEKLKKTTNIKHRELMKKHLLEKSLFKSIIKENNSNKKAIEQYEEELKGYDIEVSKEIIENEMLDLAMGLQSNNFTLERGLQHEPTDESVKIYKAETERSLELGKRDNLYKATGSVLTIIHNIIEAVKSKGGVGIAANSTVVIEVAEQAITNLRENYTFGTDYVFKQLGTVYNPDLENTINDLDKVFVEKYNNWLFDNYPNISRKLARVHQKLTTMSSRVAILITVNTDTVKNQFTFGVNLNTITMALYQVGSALNIPMNLLLHVGTHPTIREFTKDPTDASLEQINKKINDLGKEIRTEYIEKNVLENGQRKKLETYLSLDDLFIYGKGYDFEFKYEENQVLVHFTRNNSRHNSYRPEYKYLMEEGVTAQSIRALIEVAKSNPNKTYFLTEVPQGSKWINLQNIIIEVGDLPNNIQLSKAYSDNIGDLELKKKEADYKILSFLNNVYKFSQELRILQPIANLNKGDTSIANYFNIINLLKSKNNTLTPSQLEDAQDLIKRMGSKILINGVSAFDYGHDIIESDEEYNERIKRKVEEAKKFDESIAIAEKVDDKEYTDWEYTDTDKEEVKDDDPSISEESIKVETAEVLTAKMNEETEGLKVSIEAQKEQLFSPDSVGKMIGLEDEMLAQIDIPNNTKPSLKVMFIANVKMLSAYFPIFKEMAMPMLTQTTLASKEGIKILRDMNTTYYDDKVIPLVSFIKQGVLRKSFSNYNKLLDEFQRFKDLTYIKYVKDKKDDTDDANVLVGVPTVVGKINTITLPVIMDILVKKLQERYPTNRFAQLLTIQGRDDDGNAVVGFPMIKNNSQSLDLEKEHIMNALSFILEDTDKLMMQVAGDDFRMFDITYSDLVKMILDIDLYSRAGEWSNSAILSFVPNSFYVALSQNIKEYERFKKTLKNEDQKKLANLVMDLGNNLFLAKLWEIKQLYVPEKIVKKLSFVESLPFTKKKKKEDGSFTDENVTVVLVQSFETEKSYGNYVRFKNASYKLNTISKIKEKEVTILPEFVNGIQTKPLRKEKVPEAKTSYVYTLVKNPIKKDASKYLTTFERHIYNATPHITSLNPNAILISTNNTLVELLPSGQESTFRSFNTIAVNGDLIKLGKAQKLKINIQEMLLSQLGEDIILEPYEEREDIPFEDYIPFYPIVKKIKKDLLKHKQLIDFLIENEETSLYLLESIEKEVSKDTIDYLSKGYELTELFINDTIDDYIDELIEKKRFLEYREKTKHDLIKFLDTKPFVSKQLKALIPFLYKLEGDYEITIYDKVFSLHEKTTNKVITSDITESFDMDFSKWSADAFTTLLFERDSEYIKDLNNFKEVIDITVDNANNQIELGSVKNRVVVNLFRKKYGYQSLQAWSKVEQTKELKEGEIPTSEPTSMFAELEKAVDLENTNRDTKLDEGKVKLLNEVNPTNKTEDANETTCSKTNKVKKIIESKRK